MGKKHVLIEDAWFVDSFPLTPDLTPRKSGDSRGRCKLTLKCAEGQMIGAEEKKPSRHDFVFWQDNMWQCHRINVSWC